MGSRYHEPPPVDDNDAVLAASFELFAKIGEGGEPGKLFANLDDVRGLETRPAGQPTDGSIDSKSGKPVLASSPMEPRSQEANEGPTEAEWAASMKLSSDSLPRNRYKRGLPMFHRQEMAELGEMIHSGRIQYWSVNHSSVCPFCSGLELPADHGFLDSSKPRIDYENNHNYEIRTENEPYVGNYDYRPLPLKGVLVPVEPTSKLVTRTAKLSVVFYKELARWKASEPSRELAEILKRAKTPPIKKIVAFGLGSMVGEYDDEPNYRPIIQHAMLIQVAEFFHETRPSIILQDPGYRDHDKAVIESLWVEARFADDPQGFLEIDDDTLVISIDPDVPVRSIVADIATPAAMIWAGRPVWAYMDPTEKVRARDPASPRLDYLMTHLYAAIPYPACPYTNTLCSMGWKASVLNQIICFRDIDHLKHDHTQDKAMTDLGLGHLLLKARGIVGTTPAAENGTTSAAAIMSWVLNGTVS